MFMRAILSVAGVLAVLAAGNHDVAQGGVAATGCTALGKLKSVFPAAATIRFAERLQIKPQGARQPIWPGRCGAFWTTYKVNGRAIDVSVTLYKTSRHVGAALAETQFGDVHVLPNGARVRTLGQAPANVNGVPALTAAAVSAFRNLFISSISIATAMKPVPVAVQLRIHHGIETAFARLLATH
jgi:hypothetical protein